MIASCRLSDQGQESRTVEIESRRLEDPIKRPSPIGDLLVMLLVPLWVLLILLWALMGFSAGL